jgi:hypothetical protein
MRDPARYASDAPSTECSAQVSQNAGSATFASVAELHFEDAFAKGAGSA